MMMCLRQQREIIYKQRFDVLESENLRDIVEQMITSSLERNIVAHVRCPKQVDYQSLLDYIHGNLLMKVKLTLQMFQEKMRKKLLIFDGKVIEHYNEKEEQLS